MRNDLASLLKDGAGRWLTLGILLLALAARMPGVFWGYNFPVGGWVDQHMDEPTHVGIAERIINPAVATSREGLSYPKATALSVALPIKAIRLATHTSSAPLPPRQALVTAGRMVSVLFGVATVFVLMLFMQRLWGEVSLSLMAGALAALGGLHVAQSHFFLSDVPALFWFVLGLYLVFIDLDSPEPRSPGYLHWGGFALGAAAGTKLLVAGLPSLMLAALLRRPRLSRFASAGVFALAGFAAVNALSYSMLDVVDTVRNGYRFPFSTDRLQGALLYLMELPSVYGAPVVLLAIVGAVVLARQTAALRHTPRRRAIVVAVVLPVIPILWSVILQLDHFPRHLLQFFPWIIGCAAFGFHAVTERVRARRIPAWALAVPVIAWMALFVFDSERMFISEPRNRAATWLATSLPEHSDYFWSLHPLPGHRNVFFPDQGRPPILVIEMLDANRLLSGQSWRNSYPRDARHTWGAWSQAWLDQTQALFRGRSEYREVARFSEGYFMPEYVLTNRILGDRSRSFVTELVVFRRDTIPAPPTTHPGDDGR